MSDDILNSPHSFGNYFDSDKPIPRSQCTCPCHDPNKMVSHGRQCCYPDPEPIPQGFSWTDPDEYEYSREAGCTWKCSND